METLKLLNLFVKRLADILGSSIGLILTSPLLLITVLFIKLTMPGPIFFKQERIGKNESQFEILKFRTMKVDKEAEKNLDFSKDKDRLTSVGKILRRTKIDELPQLINVLKGNMSLVGPRPTILKQVKLYTKHQKKRLEMRPGMTGLAQVNGNITLPWGQRIEYDIEYVENFTVILDCKILFKTIGIILLGEEKFKKEKKSEDIVGK